MQRLEPRALVELFLSGVLLAYKERKKKLGLMPETLRQNLTLSSELLKKKLRTRLLIHLIPTHYILALVSSEPIISLIGST